MPDCYLNGSFQDESSAHVSIKDAGLLHGAGVFTTMRAVDGAIVHLEAHLKRLRASCEALQIPVEHDDDELADAAGQLLLRNDLSDARLRITATRGDTAAEAATLLITAATMEGYPPALYEKGMTLAVSDQIKLNPYDVQAGHKTLDYLSRFSALRDAHRRGANEAAMFNVHNFLQGGAISNVFLVRNKIVLTPPVNHDLSSESIKSITPYPRSNALPGTTRGAVLEAARELSIEVQIKPLTIADLLEADEVFLTNSMMRVMPVCRVERKSIGDEKPGTITRLLDAKVP